ncbi:hypothetical protein [Poriferisphaera sp. WC338]|uniref:hypothetical protein n=1 Tax=Poriferisphaera sp. WC338 TaxID=3425129 RepID=UPI003D8179F2
MIENQDIQKLQNELARLRDQHLNGTVDTADLWEVMQQASSLLDQARGSRFEDVLDVILNLLNSIWSNHRNQQKLQHLKSVAANF